MRMDPLLANLQVYCAGDRSEYLKPFQTVPPIYDLELLGLEDTERPSSAEFTKSIQIRLSFGIIADICRVCEVHFDASDLLARGEESSREKVSFGNIEKYLYFLVASESDRSIEERQEHQSAYRSMLQTATRFVNRRLLVLPRTIASMTAMEKTESTVLVSIMALVSYLTYNTTYIFALSWIRPKIDWVRSPIIDGLLLKSAWCQGEINRLYADYAPPMLLYLSTFDRKRPDKSHTACTSEDCVVNQIDNATYRTAHAPGCPRQNCSIIQSPGQEVCDILQDPVGAIPLIRLVDSSTGPRIETTSFHLDDRRKDYTAISHVWSDGTGNPGVNGLYECQLRKIQSQVDELNPDSKGDNYFWMDTLCVPLVSGLKAKAIVLMSKTYVHATKVLVLDRWLETFQFQGDPRQLLARVGTSDWNTRLWTHNEALLARECRFQLSTGSISVDRFMDHSESTEGIQKISGILQSLPVEYFKRHKYARLLLKAMCLEFQSQDLLSGTLSSSSTEVEAQSSLGASGRELPDALVMDQLKLMDNGLSHLNVSELAADDLKDHVKTAMIDPKLHQSIRSLHNVRGVFYSSIIDRAKDSGGISRQLHGFGAPPHVLLMNVAQGFQGRTTSRQEDETICLGGLLGLDVSPILAITVERGKRQEQEVAVCDERMKVFMLLLGKITPTVLFCHVARVQLPGFHWVPRSFLGREEIIRRQARQYADITPRGLAISSGGVRIPKVKTSELYEKRQLLIQDPTSEGSVPLSRRFWQHVKLPSDFQIPETGNDEEFRDCILIVDVTSMDDGFLAFVENERGEEELICRYLTAVSPIPPEPGQQPLSAVGHWFWERDLQLT